MKKIDQTLHLWEGSRPCIHCGYCCKVRSCGYGKWDEEKHQCTSLVSKPDGTYDCGKFKEIVNGPDKSWHLAPAFGAGCCSPWNEDRIKLERQGMQ